MCLKAWEMSGLKEISVPLSDVDVLVRYEEKGTGLPIVFLHGFTGDSRDWLHFSRKVAIDRPWVAIDLLGHGQTSAPDLAQRYQMQRQVADLDAIAAYLKLNSFFLLGYSMGGRTALTYTMQHPQRVYGLILESASPGLLTEEEQEMRRSSDELLARRILEVGMDQFSEEWGRLPLFFTQQILTSEEKTFQQTVRKSQRARGLAGSLRGMGTGSQPSLWNELSSLSMPVLFITGELDEKFTKIAVSMQRAVPHAQHAIMQGVGHNVHLESPVEFWRETEQFMKAISR